ncbi:hypothetical protein BC941DRAFT_211701 [Chlamydoabsidia padenii]|nr:hypothetical protein BC941DRAFT_211701 [Chlamydoabsidia padenii]
MYPIRRVYFLHLFFFLHPLCLLSARLQRLTNQTIHVVMLATWYESTLSIPSPHFHYVENFSGGVTASPPILHFGI